MTLRIVAALYVLTNANSKSRGVNLKTPTGISILPELQEWRLSATEPFALGLPRCLFYDRRMVRQAVCQPSAVRAIPLILQAIGHIAFVLTGTTDSEEAASVLNDFFGQEDNRISYQNALVLEEEGEVVGVAIFYDGAKARELDAPLERAAAKKSSDSNYCIPTEPEASEFYLDALSVSPRCQRKGYGRQLIEAGCDEDRKLGHHRMALLIEVDNAAAKPLYEQLGFCTDYTKRIAGQEYFSHGTEFVMHPGRCVPCFEWSLLPKVRDIFLYAII